ncbi:hypothetical protein GX48_00846 [Paracoccidioides brasiliensis]|nr:hypothetical protein GX48_00846 [Paracoccidioides brasiliensis]
MPMGKHEDRILDCSIPLVIKDIKGKSVIMAGGASGLGRPFVEAFTKAGCALHVTFGDVDGESGSSLAAELAGVLEEQVRLFEMAIMNSPSSTSDIVIANAGKAGPDGLFGDDDEDKFAFTLETRPHQILPRIMTVVLRIRSP